MMFETLDYSKKWPVNTMIRETDKVLAQVGLKPKYKLKNKCRLCGHKIDINERVAGENRPYHILLCTKCRRPIFDKLLGGKQ